MEHPRLDGERRERGGGGGQTDTASKSWRGAAKTPSSRVPMGAYIVTMEAQVLYCGGSDPVKLLLLIFLQ